MGAESESLDLRLAKHLWASPLVRGFLERWRELALPEPWLGAGCIAQTVWNTLTDQPLGAHIRDIDIVYFDEDDLSAEAETTHEQRLRAAFPELVIPLDVKNQARVHLWYPELFGRSIAPYSSVEAAVRTWPTPATSIVVRPGPVGWTHSSGISQELEVYAPFGLDDLFGGIVRPNKALIEAGVYEAKVRRWRTCWPGLQYESW